MVVTRSQGAPDEEQQPRVFDRPPRSPSVQASANATATATGTALPETNPAAPERVPAPISGTPLENPTGGRLEYAGVGEPTRPMYRDMEVRPSTSATVHEELLTNVPHPVSTELRHNRARTPSSLAAKLKYEAEAQILTLSRKMMELDAKLIASKLAAELAALEDADDGDVVPAAEETAAQERVKSWLEHAPAPELSPELRPRTDGGTTRPAPVTAPAGRMYAEEYRRMPPLRQAIELPIFTGSPTEWLNFKTAYEETTELYQLLPIENMARLRNCLRGEAREAVAALLSTATHPDQVMRTLGQCFGHPDALLNKALEDIQALPKIGRTATEMNTFAVKLQNIVAVLGTLSREYLLNPTLTKQVLEKLEKHQRMMWCKHAAGKYPNGQATIKELAEFLMEEANLMLRYDFSTPSTSSTGPTRAVQNNQAAPYRKAAQPQARKTFNVSTNKYECPECSEEHTLRDCKGFKDKSVNDRWELVKEKRLCFKCLASRHRSMNCRAKPCGVEGCRRPHHALLHTAKEPEPKNVVVASATENDRSIKLKICQVFVHSDKGFVKTYALFDEGSTVTLVDEDLANSVGAFGKPTTLRIKGINTDKCAESKEVTMKIHGSNRKEIHLLKARTIKNLDLTSQSVPRSILKMKHLKGLRPNEVTYAEVKPKILIGTDNWHLIVTRQLRAGRNTEPAASRTSLGWVIHGTVPSRTIQQGPERVLHVVTGPVGLHEAVERHFDINDIGIKNRPMMSTEHKRAETIFMETVKRTPEGRIEVGLPWKEGVNQLPPSYNMALRRLKGLEKRMTPEDRALYQQQIEGWLKKGYARPCTPDDLKSLIAWYLPHFAVKNVNKPGKLRVVMDAAAKSHGVSLNDHLLEGPDKLMSLMGILFRFREGAVAVVADIEEMFLRIIIREQDQPAQMFLWRENPDEAPQIYVMRSMIFGATSSPFLAHSVRDWNAEQFESTHPNAFRAITKAHYMDDYVDSFSDEHEARQTIKEVNEVHEKAGFNLRAWSSNAREILDDIPENRRSQEQAQLLNRSYEKTLGLYWEPREDVLLYNTKMLRVPADVRNLKRIPTKREALSAVMSIYDPMGLISAYTVTARIELQRLWREELGWDQQLPEQAADGFKNWIATLDEIGSLKIPRQYFRETARTVQLHVFCDASEEAYAAVAYWRTTTDNSIETALVSAKARVAPLKAQTVPRLELQAALIGCRLAKTIEQEHRLHIDRIIFWSDSTTVLHWIRHGQKKYTTYVANRLSEILESTEPGQWKWVPTNLNIADVATRTGYIPTDRDVWFTGPEFLRNDEKHWPKPLKTVEITEETILVVQRNEPLIDIGRFSTWEKLIGTTARVFVFMERCRKKTSSLDVEHLQAAENYWIRQAQQENFKEEIACVKAGRRLPRTSPLKNLELILEDDILRLRGRIQKASTDKDMKNPIVLSGRHPVTRLLVAREHRRALHANNERVVNDLRQRFFILRLRTTVRAIAHSCPLCRIRRSQPTSVPTGDLPAARLGAYQRPFSNCGVDYFGPMTVTIGRRHEKRWGALFTCLTTRAVHIELVASLNIDSAVMALRRMAARRGWPSIIYSDNGTNFRGADVELRRAYEEWLPHLKEWGLKYNTSWRFIPPGAPHQGGAWERMVRSVKTALATTLHQRAPKEEVLATLLTEAEYSINCRPLTHVSVDPADPEALTPNHFLLGTSSGLPATGPCEEADRRTWRAAQALADNFWRRWVREYLPTLVPRTHSGMANPNLEVGDLVVVVDPTLPRNTWPRGIVERTYPGPDGRVRSADVATNGGIFRRPVTKLAVLALAKGDHTD